MKPDTLELLRRYESRNVTFMEPDGSWPIVWERAQGVHVWDANGKRYLDLTAAFGVASVGHGNPRVVRAGQEQMTKLLHAMGDVHPHRRKAELARELNLLWGQSMVTTSRDRRSTAKTIFCSSGFEAVEAALKTALLATNRAGVIAFEGAYHGLGYGALNATHRDHFRAGFRRQLAEFSRFVPYPTIAASLPAIEKALRRSFASEPIGAVIVEPMQARGGIHIPPRGFLPLLRRLCDEHGALLILDEIYTGFGRTGRWFACEHSRTSPDLVCLGKALTGGFPLSACVGRAEVMDAAWPESTGEAIHTSTFLGHPVGCAMALAQIGEIRRRNLPKRSEALGRTLLVALKKLRAPGLKLSARGCGLFAGLELKHNDGSPATSETLAIIKRLLHRGFIFLPEGERANVISFTPPLTITSAQLLGAVRALDTELRRLA
jgi:4-aminobutyrate aminotransferase-like enzyme